VTPEELFEKYALEGWSGDAPAVGPEEFAAVVGPLLALVDIVGDGFHRSAGTSQTSWDECTECSQADWEGHKKNCELAAKIVAAREISGLPLKERFWAGWNSKPAVKS